LVQSKKNSLVSNVLLIVVVRSMEIISNFVTLILRSQDGR